MAFIKNPPGSSAVHKMVMDRLSKFSLSRKSKDWSKKELMQMVELQEAQLIQMETQNQHLNKLQIALSDSLRVTIGRFEAIPIGLMRIDRSSEIQMINHRCAQIFLVDRLKLIGSNISQYLSVAGLAIFEGLMAQNKISNEVAFEDLIIFPAHGAVRSVRLFLSSDPHSSACLTAWVDMPAAV